MGAGERAGRGKGKGKGKGVGPPVVAVWLNPLSEPIGMTMDFSRRLGGWRTGGQIRAQGVQASLTPAAQAFLKEAAARVVLPAAL